MSGKGKRSEGKEGDKGWSGGRRVNKEVKEMSGQEVKTDSKERSKNALPRVVLTSQVLSFVRG